MLVYIREDQKDVILQTPVKNDVPRLLSDKFTEEATVLNQMQKELDVHIDCGIVYLISPETIATNWLENQEVKVP